MNRTFIVGIAMLLFGTASDFSSAFTAIAWSDLGQKSGSAKNAPTQADAISAAIADCKKNGGGADCHVLKVTDEPGFVALYITCAKRCAVSAVGRPTPEQARVDGKHDCEAQFRNPCQLVQEWEENGSTAGKAARASPTND